MKNYFIRKIFVVSLFCLFTAATLCHSENVHSEEDLSESSFDEKFLLSDYNIIPGIKDQGNANSCWTFTTFGAIESNLLKKNIYIDFSEAFLSYLPFSGLEAFPHTKNPERFLNNGGSSYIASSVVAAGQGMVTEKEIGYDSSSYDIELFLDKNSNISSDFIIKDIDHLSPFLSPETQADEKKIKTILSQKDPVICSVSLNNAYFNQETGALSRTDSYHFSDDNNCHSVMIIGWDNTYSKNNFVSDHMPENDGAWCAWSSSGFGNDSGKGGILWISYENSSLINPVVYSSVDINYYQNIYQYDTFGWSTSLNYGIAASNITEAQNMEKYNTGTMANIFTAKDTEVISAVGFYTISENVDYCISLFTNIPVDTSDNTHVNPGYANRTNDDDDDDGYVRINSGTIRHPGFHVIELSQKIPVYKDSSFSVVIEITDTHSKYFFPVEAAVKYTNSKDTRYNLNPNSRLISPNESFIFDPQNGKWLDLAGDNSGYHYTEISMTAPFTENCPILPYPELAQRSDEKDDPENDYKITYLKAAIGNLCIKAYSEHVLTGDIDFNNVVNAEDLLKYEKKFLKQRTSLKNLDINNDNKVDILDCVELKRIIASAENSDTKPDPVEQRNIKISEYYTPGDYSLLNSSDIKK